MALEPPTPSVLTALPDDVWASLVGHARRVLRQPGRATDGQTRPTPSELASASTVDLLSGDGRAMLMAELSAGGALWEGVAARLAQDEAVWHERLHPPQVPATTRAELEEVPSQDARHHQRKARIRELTEQRDRARRQAEGADARARTAEERLAELAGELEVAHDRIHELERRVDDSAHEREAALDRQRRQVEGEALALREQLRALRRAEEERRAEERRREEAEQAARRAAAQAQSETRRATRTGPPRAQPGRPSRLPRGMQPGTSAAARALLTPQHQVFVDGYNLTLKHRGHLDLEQQRAALIATLESAAARFRCDITVLFDTRHGSAPVGHRSRTIQVRFTRAGVTADDEIVLEVSTAPEDRPILVVTDDRELRERVRPHAVDVLGTGEFLRAVE